MHYNILSLIALVLASTSSLAAQRQVPCMELVGGYAAADLSQSLTPDFTVKTRKISIASDFFELKDVRSSLYAISVMASANIKAVAQDQPTRVNAQYLIRVDQDCKQTSLFKIDSQSSRQQ